MTARRSCQHAARRAARALNAFSACLLTMAAHAGTPGRLGSGYARAQHLTPLAGHWAYCRDAQRGPIDIGAMEFPADADSDGDGFSDSQEVTTGTEADRYVLRLKGGWNLISICRKPTDSSPHAVFGRGALFGPVWQWAGDHYEKTVSLEPLLAYWYTPSRTPRLMWCCREG